jgi:hypothetical protein
MAFQLSPGVTFTEKDNTNVVASSGTSTGAFAGIFSWGPSNQRTRIDSENALVNVFGKPTGNNFTSFFSAANFLAYTNNLIVIRATAINTYCADANTSPANLNLQNERDWEINYHNSPTAKSQLGPFCARYPGSLGNSLTISVCSNRTAFKSPAVYANTVAGNNQIIISPVTNGAQFVATTTGNANTFANTYAFSANDIITISNVDYTISAVSANTITVTNTSLPKITANNQRSTVSWKYASLFPNKPNTSIYATNNNGLYDELSIAVIDTDGAFTGIKGYVLETYDRVSKSLDAKTDDGSPNNYDHVLFNKSKYIYTAANIPSSTNWNTATINTTFDSPINYTVKLAGGTDTAPGDSDIITSFSHFSNPDTVQVDLVITGSVSDTVINNVLSLVNNRKDCLAFISPPLAYSVSTPNSDSIVEWKNSNLSPLTSYSVMDSGWKYQFDKYNAVYRYIPLNADIAGLCARTDRTNDSWWSPAGFNRGQILNAIKLSWNPSQTDRDVLYQANINPVVAFPGQGIVLYGDKTTQSKASAFDRINVRRLFLQLERKIANAAKYSMFEFNDTYTQASFISLVEPYLRAIKAGRGIYAYKVVCDSSNNPASVRDQNGFVGDIYIQPAKSINYIQLNFTAVNSGVTFTEIAGGSSL